MKLPLLNEFVISRLVDNADYKEFTSSSNIFEDLKSLKIIGFSIVCK